MSSALFEALLVLVGAYLLGSTPWAYLIVKYVTGSDIETHGSGNVGAMNVRRATGSWAWFAAAMVMDGLKGLVAVGVAKAIVGGLSLGWLAQPMGNLVATDPALASVFWRIALLPQAAVLGSVLGHNYSLWMNLIERRLHRTGKGLAAGGGALLAYDWRYFVIGIVVALAVIAVTRYMMAGQVAAAAALPLAAVALGSPDWPFTLLVGVTVYSAHHKRFVGLLRGREPRMYTNDKMGPVG